MHPDAGPFAWFFSTRRICSNQGMLVSSLNWGGHCGRETHWEQWASQISNAAFTPCLIHTTDYKRTPHLINFHEDNVPPQSNLMISLLLSKTCHSLGFTGSLQNSIFISASLLHVSTAWKLDHIAKLAMNLPLSGIASSSLPQWRAHWCMLCHF